MTESTHPVLWTTPLARIAHPKGDLYHGLKASEDSFDMFGEAYFTTVAKDATKGWKRHTVMRLNLLVPVGSVTFFVHDEATRATSSITINSANYLRLTVEPGFWMAFRGREDLNVVLNIASVEHDPNEEEAAELDRFPFSSGWASTES